MRGVWRSAPNLSSDQETMSQQTATKPTDEVDLETPPPETIRLQATTRLRPRARAARALALPRPRLPDRRPRRHRPLPPDRPRRRLGDPAAGRLHGRLLALLRPRRRASPPTACPTRSSASRRWSPGRSSPTRFLLGSESLVLNQALVSKIYFPRIFIPAGVVAAGCVDFAISLVILLRDRPHLRDRARRWRSWRCRC